MGMPSAMPKRKRDTAGNPALGMRYLRLEAEADAAVRAAERSAGKGKEKVGN